MDEGFQDGENMTELKETAESWGREMRKGYTKLAVLTLLNKKPMTGYDIMKEIKEKTLGFWALTPGGVYPVLTELEGKGYIKGQWKAKGERRKKIYKITDEGKHMLEIALRKQQQMAETIGSLFRRFAHEALGTKMPPTPRTFDFFLFEKSLEDKPIDEQTRLLKSVRTRMRSAIKLIGKKLEKLEQLK